jgi:hypothetical protein
MINSQVCGESLETLKNKSEDRETERRPANCSAETECFRRFVSLPSEEASETE